MFFFYSKLALDMHRAGPSDRGRIVGPDSIRCADFDRSNCIRILRHYTTPVPLRLNSFSADQLNDDSLRNKCGLIKMFTLLNKFTFRRCTSPTGNEQRHVRLNVIGAGSQTSRSNRIGEHNRQRQLNQRYVIVPSTRCVIGMRDNSLNTKNDSIELTERKKRRHSRQHSRQCSLLGQQPRLRRCAG